LSKKAEELTAEQAAEVNKLGSKFNIGTGTFFKLMKLDHQEQEDTAEIKEIDRAKLQLSVCNYFFFY